MTLNLITAPTVEPVALPEVKKHLGIDLESTYYDERLQRLIVGARNAIENETGQRLITQEVDYYFDNLTPVIKFPVLPIQSIGTFQYYDENGTLKAMDTSLYFSDLVSKPPKIVLKSDQSWPSLEAKRPNRVVMRLTVGYGDAEDVPEEIGIAMLMVIEKIFDRPETSYQDALDRCKNSVLGQHFFNWF